MNPFRLQLLGVLSWILDSGFRILDVDLYCFPLTGPLHVLIILAIHQADQQTGSELATVCDPYAPFICGETDERGKRNPDSCPLLVFASRPVVASSVVIRT